jgi:hypothetical protein
MSAYKPTFISKTTNIPSIGRVVLMHEDPAQQIQGGSPGEHYHLTAAQVAQTAQHKVYEPVYINGEPVFVGDPLDILVAWGGKYAA